jgi:hypothetical protein
MLQHKGSRVPHHMVQGRATECTEPSSLLHTLTLLQRLQDNIHDCLLHDRTRLLDILPVQYPTTAAAVGRLTDDASAWAVWAVAPGLHI